jgi:hypothetical protein
VLKPAEDGPNPFWDDALKLPRVAVVMVECQRCCLSSPAVAIAPSSPRASSSCRTAQRKAAGCPDALDFGRILDREAEPANQKSLCAADLVKQIISCVRRGPRHQAEGVTRDNPRPSIRRPGANCPWLRVACIDSSWARAHVKTDAVRRHWTQALDCLTYRREGDRS